jgi:hypothetical protein
MRLNKPIVYFDRGMSLIGPHRGEPLWPKLYVYVYIGQGPITNLKRPPWLGSAIEYKPLLTKR